MRRLIVIGSAVLLLAFVLAGWMDSRQPEPVALIPTLTGQPEYCLTCHADLPEISPSHPIETFGCVLCHGGERLALDADLAHSTMRGGNNPSDLLVVEASCGGSDCHSGSPAEKRDHIQRVMTSIQTTYAGAISSIRFTFGAQPDQTARQGIFAVTDEETRTSVTSLAAFDPPAEGNPFVRKFANNCLTCHINAPPPEGEVYKRLTGCAACHSPVLSPPSGEGRDEGDVHLLTTAIPYTQCNSCHNRGNYDLRKMEFVERTDHPIRRMDDYYQPIAQFVLCEYTLDCVDCHTRNEAMGDGDLHGNKKDIQYIQCRTCHGTPTELPLTRTLTDPDDIAFTLAFLNPVVGLKPGDTILVTEKGEALWNTLALPDGTFSMVGMATRQYFIFRPVMGSACTQTGDDQSSAYCHTCHAVQR